MELQKRFIVIAFPRSDSALNEGDTGKGRVWREMPPTFVWGHDTFAPSVKGKWIKLHEPRDARRISEQHVWHLSSEDACAVRDAGIRNDLSNGYAFQIMEVITINLSAAEIEARAAERRRLG